MRTMLLTALLLAGVAGQHASVPSAEDHPAVEDFTRRLDAYVELHRRLEGPLPTLEVSDDLTEVHAAMQALAREIREARPRAKQGDILTPAAARVFRHRIASCLPADRMAAILAEDDEESPAVLPRLRVNAAWPAGMPFNYVPAQMLAILPPLPPELQYRIIGRSLVLWDHHANIIVDFVEDAFPR